MPYHSMYRKKVITNSNNAKIRELQIPSPRLKRTQKDKLKMLEHLDKLHVSNYAYAYRKGLKDPITHMLGRLGADKIDRVQVHIMACDIRHFFSSIKQGYIYSMLRGTGMSNQLAGHIADLACYKGSLAVGSPLSPLLSNAFLNAFDEAIGSEVETKYLGTYARYCDDLFFSIEQDPWERGYNDNDRAIFQQILDSTAWRLGQYGLTLNKSKTRINPPKILGVEVVYDWDGANNDSLTN